MASTAVVTAPARGASRVINMSWDLTNPTGTSLGGNWKREGCARGGARNNEYFWDAVEAGGYAKQEGYKGALCNNIAGTRVAVGAMTPLLARRPVSPGLVLPDYWQVHQYEFVLSISGPGALATDTGLLFYASSGNTPGLLWNGANMGFGLALNAAGNIEWRLRNSTNTGQDVYGEQIAMNAFIPDRTEWWKATVRFYHAKPDADAYMVILINDVPAITRTWGVGTVMPTLPATVNGLEAYAWRAYLAGANWASGTGGGVRVMAASFISGPDDPGTY